MEQQDLQQLNAEIKAESRFVEKIITGMGQTIVGQDHLVRALLIGLLADGHILLEGVPGLAKTLAIKTLSDLIRADYSRIQFTPDLLPADVVGTMMYSRNKEEFVVKKGPVFANFVLADEINRAPAKTQAALFEVMEERQVTIDGTTRRMSDVYTIIATQNPVEQEGTYRLPEAQLDRFLFKISMGYPSVDEEMNILKRHQEKRNLIKLEDVKPILTIDELLQMRKKLDTVFIEESLLRYIANIVQQTRTSKAVYLGASPRASVAMHNAAKASALLGGRDFVTPEDIKFVTPSILQHRLILTAEAEMEGYTPLKVAQKLIDKVEVPK